MQTTNKIESTKNYGLFEIHEFNRPLRIGTLRHLEKSMLKYGFRKSDAIHVAKKSNGKYKILRGHHRYATAKKLGIAIYYIVDIDIDISCEERTFKTQWTTTEHVKAYAAQGNKNYIRLIEFAEKHKLPITTAAFIMAGYVNKVGAVQHHLRNGTFIVDEKYQAVAITICAVLAECDIAGLRFAKTRAFVNAICSLFRVPEFDPEFLIRRIKIDGSRIACRNSRDDFLEEIESLYNYRSHGEYIPLRGMAIAKVGRIT